LERKVAELAEALKRSHDKKKIAEAALEESKKELEKVQNLTKTISASSKSFGKNKSELQKSPRTFASTMPASPSH
jgi:DNA repair exonuclease SbcCD ATPase subunit